jgi:hypothetical protein
MTAVGILECEEDKGVGMATGLARLPGREDVRPRAPAGGAVAHRSVAVIIRPSQDEAPFEVVPASAAKASTRRSTPFFGCRRPVQR